MIPANEIGKKRDKKTNVVRKNTFQMKEKKTKRKGQKIKGEKTVSQKS